jgi:hypothetical protein
LPAYSPAIEDTLVVVTEAIAAAGISVSLADQRRLSFECTAVAFIAAGDERRIMAGPPPG